MGKSLLFVSRYPEIIEEFTREMADQEIDIDVADNGIDAAILLRKKEYQVVVTGLTLDGFNGEQIVTYINKTYPDTVCIIYTTTISAAQLHFFINERDVYRVFLRPVNFRKEFFEALQEAFEYNAVKKKDREEEEIRRKKLINNRNAVKDMELSLKRQNYGWDGLDKFSQKVVSYTQERHTAGMEPEKREKLCKVENDIVKRSCHENEEEKILQIVEEASKILEML